MEQDTLSLASMPLATMSKTLVFTAFSLLCTTYRAKMWSKTRCHKHPCLWRPCPKHCIYSVIVFCTTYCARMWSKTRCHNHPCLWRPCPKHCICSVFASLYNIPRKDVEQDTFSQASMPLATMSKTLHLQRFCFFVQHTVQVVLSFVKNV